jgi:VanZ family protein
MPRWPLVLAAWTCLVALAVLSLLPEKAMIRTGVNGHVEHFIAYAGATAIVVSAYARRHAVPSLAAMLMLYAGLLEAGQNFSPGRHPSILDFAASAAGVIAGACAFALARLMARRAPATTGD